MRILDLQRPLHLLDRIALEEQAVRLRAEGLVPVVLDATGMTPQQLNTAMARHLRTVDALLVRGLELFAMLALPGLPVFLDHRTPYELGRTSPLRAKLARVRRAFCYSSEAAQALAEAGLVRNRLIPGPFLSPSPTPLPEKAAVGVLRTGAEAQRALMAVLEYRDRTMQPWPIYSTLSARGVTVLGTDIEVADRSSMLVAPTDADLGQPHWGALLAAATGRILVAKKTSALDNLPYPNGSFSHVVGDSWGGGVQYVLSTPQNTAEWARRSRAYPDRLPELLRESLETS